MGTWGADLFDDDEACDVRDGFLAKIAEGFTTEEAARVLAPGDWTGEDGDVLWLALAATQTGVGRLEPSVLDRAIAIIDGGRDVDRFANDPRLHKKRVAVLARLRARLTGPQRKPRAVKPVPRHQTALAFGDVVAYRLASGRLSLWRVISHHEDLGGRHAVVEVLKEAYAGLPNAFAAMITPGARDQQRAKVFSLIVTSELETSDRLKVTELGRAGITRLALRLRNPAGSRPGDSLCVLPVRPVDEILAEWLGLR